jgi:5-methyltetrahydropteroyltriglutamate--homocysteine methyltransferase
MKNEQKQSAARPQVPLTTIIGYPRLGGHRELKFALEGFFRGEKTAAQARQTADEIRRRHFALQRQKGLDLIPVGDFSLYDGVLDAAVCVGAVPKRYRALGLDEAGTYFAMARGFQGEAGDVKALPMKKWFDTNYHYLVPEIEDETDFSLHAADLLSALDEAQAQDVPVRLELVGPFTFLKLAHFPGHETAETAAPRLTAVYAELLEALAARQQRPAWVSFEEPALVRDLTAQDLALFSAIYAPLLAKKQGLRVLCQTYFGDVRDSLPTLLSLPFDGIGLDFVAGRRNLALLSEATWPQGVTLFAGVVNGRNIWRTDEAGTLALLRDIRAAVPGAPLVLSSSCSLLHVPVSTRFETALPEAVLAHFAFAEEKLDELAELRTLCAGGNGSEGILARNQALFEQPHAAQDEALRKRIASLRPEDFTRAVPRRQRAAVQRDALGLPLLPTTTIGSFPQTKEVRETRAAFRHHQITKAQYVERNRAFIAQCIRKQEEIGLDVLVHGEFERNDMVEYFGDHLDGFLFTENGWVQSYGTRAVKPPILWGDVRRREPITVPWSRYAQSLTKKPVKGMLTGPITILNWSFPREDIPRRDCALQIALAIREEVLDLERAGIRIIQIDEAALREKLPLRRADWHSEYLDWAIPAFRLVASGVRPETQIHTHMCYSEFQDILPDIDAMDADVITFEAARSDFALLDALRAAGFETAAGPGVYDIHSPRIPGTRELERALREICRRLGAENVWVNPDCGLKTRAEAEVWPSLQHMVEAAKRLRTQNALDATYAAGAAEPAERTGEALRA